MPYMETPSELAEQIADWFGIYGCCLQGETENESLCKWDDKKPICCRFGFVETMADRMREAVANEQKLEKVNNQP